MNLMCGAQVSEVRYLEGDAVWEARDRGEWSADLMEIARSFTSAATIYDWHLGCILSKCQRGRCGQDHAPYPARPGQKILTQNEANCHEWWRIPANSFANFD